MGFWINLIFGVLLPPLGVYLARGAHSEFVWSILWTILGYFPGQVCAVYIIIKHKGEGKQK